MDGIQIFIGSLIYIILLWTSSLTMVLSVLLGLYRRETADWHSAAGLALFPVNVRYQTIAALLLLAVLFGGSFLPQFGEFNNRFDLVLQHSPFLYYMGIGGLFVAVACGWFSFINRNSIHVLIDLMLYVSGFGMLCFSLLFVTASAGQASLANIITRFLHILFSALTLTGATVGFSLPTILKGGTKATEGAAFQALLFMLIGGGVQLIIGFVLLLVIGLDAYPVPVGHIVMTFALLLAIGVVTMAGIGITKSEKRNSLARSTATTALFTFLLMAVLRLTHFFNINQ